MVNRKLVALTLLKKENFKICDIGENTYHLFNNNTKINIFLNFGSICADAIGVFYGTKDKYFPIKNFNTVEDVINEIHSVIKLLSKNDR